MTAEAGLFDLPQDDARVLRIGSLCSGYGGLDMAVEQFFDAEPAWFCEYDAAPSKILAHHWPDIPNHGDVKTLAPRILNGDNMIDTNIDILAAGYPCQPFSAAGRRQGSDDERHLWPHVRAAIRVLRPHFVVLENVAGHRSLGFDRVLGDLAEDGFDAVWTSIRASDVGAPHHRERLFILAYPADTSSEPGGASTRHWTGPREATGERATGVGGRRRVSPTDADGVGCGQGARQSRAGEPEKPATVGGHTALLPTPVAQPSGNTPENHLRKKPGRKTVTDLAILVENDLLATGGVLPTPTAGLSTGGPDYARADRVGSGGDDLITIAARAEKNRGTNWGKYAPAIRRWENLTRPAPAPTEPNRNGRPRLNAAFAEWMMGLPAGWVTSVPGISRADQLKAIGNGVCPPQCFAAVRILLEMENPK